MRPFILGVLAALTFGACAGAQPGPTPHRLIVWGGGSSPYPNGEPVALNVTSQIASSPTDLVPQTQWWNGWAGDLTITGTRAAGSGLAYNFGTYASPNLFFTATSPGYNSSASPITVNRTIEAIDFLRQPYPAGSPYTAANFINGAPTEQQSATALKAAVAYNDWVYAGDTLGPATVKAGLYTSSPIVSLANTAVPVTNNSTQSWPPPICTWITEPGRRVTGSSNATVEIFCGHARAQGGVPVAAVVISMTDGTHTVSHTISTPTQSTRLLSFSCTATNGSATLTACGSTVGAIVGERFTVPGIPGQPKLLSMTATSLTFGQTTTCTPTTGGSETISATPGVGEAFGDGAFAGATITDAHLNTSPATIVVPVGTGATSGASTTLTVGAPASGQWAAGMWITGTNIPAGDYINTMGTSTGGAGTVNLKTASTATVSGNVTGDVLAANPGGTPVTAITVSTSSASGTATSGSCTINHVYQGTTGTVTATPGVPLPVYAATFTSSDFSSLSNGVIWWRAQVYPNIGNVILDTQTGADGTGNDWNGLAFATNGTTVSPNLHNLWGYLDASGSFAPVYAWVSGTAGGSPAVSTSAADPGSTAYYASVSAAVTAVKTYNNANRGHNDPNDAVICLTAAGSPYAGWGGSIYSLFTANEPTITLTSVITSGGTCLASPNTANVTLGHAATTANNEIPPNTRIDDLTLSDSNDVAIGFDQGNNTTALTTSLILEQDIYRPLAKAPVIYRVGSAYFLNDFIDEDAFEGYGLTVDGGLSNAMQAFGSTIICGTNTVNKATWSLFSDAGNISWGCNPTQPGAPNASAFYIQPTSMVVAFNKFMGEFGFLTFESGALQNLLDTSNIIELIDVPNGNGCEQVSADNITSPMKNVVRTYDTCQGGRFNFDYLEGVPLEQASGLAAQTTGGVLSAGTYYGQSTYALNAAPLIETASNGAGAALTVAGSGFASATVGLPQDTAHVVYLYFDTVTPPAHIATIGQITGGTSGVSSLTLAISAVANGSLPIGAQVAGTGISDAPRITACPTGGCAATGDYTLSSAETITAGTSLSAYATGVAPNQALTIVAVGAARTPPANLPGQNVSKLQFMDRFTVDQNVNVKSDVYSAAPIVANGARVGNWEGRYSVGHVGKVTVGGTVIGTSFGWQTPTSGGGDFWGALGSWNPNQINAAGSANNTWVVYKSDRSFGNSSNLLVPAYPSLNLGEGDACPNTSTTNAASRVPSGLAGWPWDVGGYTRKNDGTGWAGAYEGASCL